MVPISEPACDHCRTRLDPAVRPVTAEGAPASPPAMAPGATIATIRCSNCGARQPLDRTFCASCGEIT